MWLARVSLTVSNLCSKTKVTDKTWLNTWQFNLIPTTLKLVLKCKLQYESEIQRRPSHGLGNESDIFTAFLDGEVEKCLAHETSAKFLWT